jgi:hypothetical protein
MTLDMKEELLFAMLFFGFALLSAFLPVCGAESNVIFPSPKAGAEAWDIGDFKLPLTDVAPPSLLMSTEFRPSFGCSCMLGSTPDLALRWVPILYRTGADARELKDISETFVPQLAGCGIVASGLGLTIGASEG